MNVYGYTSASGKDLILEYIDSLTADEQADAFSVLIYMREDRMEELTIKRWQDKIMEVYFYKHNRIFYVTMEGTDIYLLHACRKQKNKTERKDTNIVISRAKELGQQLGRRFMR
ncbi:type II toxin-antitoxin system RelE/ParE family toxin [Christensenellaceae bacterium OttesenSCG-928-M15]|nr:type II toxin-antitoxin system RelE/ParE family toxin [Christensenellaceae bacterium OttesenSCG-928-M15]